jgi:integrase
MFAKQALLGVFGVRCYSKPYPSAAYRVLTGAFLMQVKLTPGFVSTATKPPSGKDRIIYWDEKRPGFGLMVSESGGRSFVFQYRNGKGESRRASLSGTTKLPDAHKWADILRGEVARGADPVAKKKTERAAQSKRGKFRTIAEEYMKREGAKVRSMDQRRAILNRLVYPEIGDKQAVKLRRGDIVALLDKIQDGHGAPMADSALMVVRRICNWHAARDDEFRSPVVRGMGRSNPGERARTRVLTDDEIRAVWRAADEIQKPAGLMVFARMLQFILLIAVRRTEAARMDRGERNGAEWLIPAVRVKNKRDFLLPLSEAATSLLDGLPVIGDKACGPVFTPTGSRPLAAFDQFKKAFDEKCGFSDWTIHDLRRTARSLMSRAGVDPDHAERVLNHAIRGIRGIYDRHAFYQEKKNALEALAGQVDRILNPSPSNVIPMRAEVRDGEPAIAVSRTAAI